MAKISSCYQLCPLIDHRSFLGVSEDSVRGCVIVTLGKNIVIRYKLSDQKQVNSWSSKHKLSAPVVYDATGQQYVGVFNANQIALWEDSLAQLNKLKKYKFTDSIECVLANSFLSTPVVVFKNGHVLPLPLALDQRRAPCNRGIPLSADEIIEDCKLITLNGVVVIAIFTKQHKKDFHLHFMPLEEGVVTRSCLRLNRSTEETLIGYCILDTALDSCCLLTLWSDGQLFCLDLPTHSVGGTTNFPGRVLTNLSAVSPKHQTAILPLSPSHVAIYGADPSEEGALLLIFNIQLCIIQCKQLFKLYTAPPRLWSAGTDSLLFVSGQHLAVAPYHLGKQRLAALVGSHNVGSNQQIATTWESENPRSTIRDGNMMELEKEIAKLSEEGLSQAKICEVLIPKVVKAEDTESLLWLLQHMSDIPESCIVCTIIFCLQNEHRELLQTVLLAPITADISTLRQLRSGLSINLVPTLLHELANLMVEFPGNQQLLEWTTLLLDAHYQQYLLSKDQVVVQQLKELKKIVESQLKGMDVWQSLEPLLLCLKNKQGFKETSALTNTQYSYNIEQLRLY